MLGQVLGYCKLCNHARGYNSWGWHSSAMATRNRLRRSFRTEYRRMTRRIPRAKLTAAKAFAVRVHCAGLKLLPGKRGSRTLHTFPFERLRKLVHTAKACRVADPCCLGWEAANGMQPNAGGLSMCKFWIVFQGRPKTVLGVCLQKGPCWELSKYQPKIFWWRHLGFGRATKL